MNDVLWFFAAILAIVFLVTGYMKLFRPDVASKRLPWTRDVPRALVVVVSILEILGALGLILPALIGIYPQLTLAAAIGLALLMLAAGAFHILRHEYDDAAVNGLLFLFVLFVAYGRLMLVPLS